MYQSSGSMAGYSTARPFVQALWDLPIPSGQYRYYNGVLHMLALLHTSGKFQLLF